MIVTHSTNLIYSFVAMVMCNLPFWCVSYTDIAWLALLGPIVPNTDILIMLYYYIMYGTPNSLWLCDFITVYENWQILLAFLDLIKLHNFYNFQLLFYSNLWNGTLYLYKGKIFGFLMGYLQNTVFHNSYPILALIEH